ncbi:MAG: YdeI/OmpD-associated family protein [Deltaproteobacteria bacterium]|nr:YdeI/OmpD-associated family protein [Deltaproteobacteria bacterium]
MGRMAGRSTGKRSKVAPSFHATDLASWRRWLRARHASERVIWLVFDKRDTGKRCLSYGDALDEALCWGWIDGIVRRIDDRTYARKFTPRRDPSKWSAVNIERMRRLLAEGRVQPAGRAVVSQRVMGEVLQGSPARKRDRAPLPVPPELERALDGCQRARAFFDSLAPSYRRNYVRWVAEAKRAETRERRVSEAVRLLASGEKVLLK